MWFEKEFNKSYNLGDENGIEGKIIAIKLLEKGISIVEIVNDTELPTEVIERLKI